MVKPYSATLKPIQNSVWGMWHCLWGCLSVCLLVLSVLVTPWQALYAAPQSASTTNQPTTQSTDDAEVTAALAIPGMNIPGLKVNPQGGLQPTATQNNSKTATSSPTLDSKTRQAQTDASAQDIQQLPVLNAPVIDTANILSSAQLQQLNNQIRGIYNAGHAQIGVIILPTTGIEPIFDYAGRAFSKWQLGSAKRDNGVLIVVATTDRKIQILTGYGIEGAIPDILAKHIIEQDIKPYFKAGDYAGGISAGVAKIDSQLQADPETMQASIDEAKAAQMGGGTGQGLPTFVKVGIFVLLASLIVSPIVKSMLGRFVGTGGVALLGSGIILGAGAPIAGVIAYFFISTLLLMVGLQTLLSQIVFSGGGGGFGGGGRSGGGGFGGGGGSFGGGGASGSW